MANRADLTADRWMLDDAPEFERFNSQRLAGIQRAPHAITAIGRLLHNSIGDDMCDVSKISIDDWTKQNLAGTIECLADFINYQIKEGTPFAGLDESTEAETAAIS